MELQDSQNNWRTMKTVHIGSHQDLRFDIPLRARLNAASRAYSCTRPQSGLSCGRLAITHDHPQLVPVPLEPTVPPRTVEPLRCEHAYQTAASRAWTALLPTPETTRHHHHRTPTTHRVTHTTAAPEPG